MQASGRFISTGACTACVGCNSDPISDIEFGHIPTPVVWYLQRCSISTSHQHSICNAPDNVFIDVVNGMTMLIGKKLDSGLAQDVFIHDERNEGKIITMTAKVGKFVEKDNKPVVILRDGQRWNSIQTGTLARH